MKTQSFLRLAQPCKNKAQPAGMASFSGKVAELSRCAKCILQPLDQLLRMQTKI
jgi:hypothetical protein